MDRNSSLSSREREKITLEETLRHEVRKKNRGKYWWVNAPITIWLLSAVVAGFVPYGYSKIQETLEVTQRKNQQAEHTLSEIEFRLRQFDELIVRSNRFQKEIMSIPDADLLRVSSNGMISSNGKKMLAFYGLAPRLRVVAELGGIYTIPRTDENANVWIGGSGYGNANLASGRGYRYEEFSSETLFSLWKQYRSLTSPKSMTTELAVQVKDQIYALERATELDDTITTLPRHFMNGLTMKEWSQQATIEEAKELRRHVINWIDSVDATWQNIVQLFPNQM